VPTGAFSNRSQQVQSALNQARGILAAEGINLNEAANGFFAGVGHNGTHSDAYFLALTGMLQTAAQDGNVAAVLSNIKSILQSGGSIL